MNLKGRSFLTLKDFTSEEIEYAGGKKYCADF